MSPSAILALLSCLCACSLWTLRMSCTQALCLVLVWGITCIQGKDLPVFVANLRKFVLPVCATLKGHGTYKTGLD